MGYTSSTDVPSSQINESHWRSPLPFTFRRFFSRRRPTDIPAAQVLYYSRSLRRNASQHEDIAPAGGARGPHRRDVRLPVLQGRRLAEPVSQVHHGDCRAKPGAGVEGGHFPDAGASRDQVPGGAGANGREERPRGFLQRCAQVWFRASGVVDAVVAGVEQLQTRAA